MYAEAIISLSLLLGSPKLLYDENVQNDDFETLPQDFIHLRTSHNFCPSCIPPVSLFT